MSLDVDVTCKCCGHIIDEESMTYDMDSVCSPVMRAVGVRGGLFGLDGRTMADVQPRAVLALAFITRHEARFRQRDLRNGLTVVSSVSRVLIMLSQSDYPRDATISVT